MTIFGPIFTVDIIIFTNYQKRRLHGANFIQFRNTSAVVGSKSGRVIPYFLSKFQRFKDTQLKVFKIWKSDKTSEVLSLSQIFKTFWLFASLWNLDFVRRTRHY